MTRTAGETKRLEELKEAFAAGAAKARASHFGGAGGMAVVRAITGLMDDLVRAVFEHALSDTGQPRRGGGWALAAIGGYGRGELNPYSDVDIMFLGHEAARGKEEALPSKVLHTLWDLGLNLGYSVRSPEDCAALSKDDFTIMTSLMEARLLSGDHGVFKEFEEKMKGRKSPKGVEEYVREKLLERTKRHKKHGGSVYLREPNIKEGAGGLRDMHTALWISRIKYGAESLDELVGLGIIKDKDLRRLKGCRDYLLRLRNELHYISGHRQDVLTFELQERAAADFGYRPRPNRMAVENFMRAYYLRARGVSEITQGIIEKALSRPKGRRWFVFPPAMKKLDDNYYTVGRLLCLEGDAEELFQARPEAVIEAFAHSQSQGAALSDNLRESISDNVRAVDCKTRECAGAGRIFLDMLGRLSGLYEALDEMHKMKVLGRYLPEFGAVTALVQHDMYHLYTVDEHSLLAVKKIQDLLTGEGMAYPEFKEALLRVTDRAALMFALLMHDVGKAAGSGHSEKGALLASAAALRMGMDKAGAEKVESLVRNHLLMAHVSQRRELSDPKVMEKFCGIVDSREMLDMLYLITYADMSTVGHDLFNDWKMLLLKELHERASAFLKDEVSLAAGQKERLSKLRDAIVTGASKKTGVGPDDVKAFLDNLPTSYPITVPVDTAVRHFELYRRLRPGEAVIEHEHSRSGYTNLTVMLHEVLSVFFVSAGALAAKNMNILSGQITSGKDGLIIVTLQVTDCNKKPALDEKLWAEIKANLLRLLTGRARVDDIMPHQPAYPKRTALRDIPVRVVVDNEASDRFTVIEVYAPDRVGLLYDITKTLYKMGCYISSAKVDTDVDQVVDVFYVRDIFKTKITDKDRISFIRDALTSAVGGETL